MNRIAISSGIAIATIALLLVTTTMSARQPALAYVGQTGASASAIANAGNGVSTITSISGSSVSAVANAGNGVSALVVNGVPTLANCIEQALAQTNQIMPLVSSTDQAPTTQSPPSQSSQPSQSSSNPPSSSIGQPPFKQNNIIPYRIQ